MTRWAAIAIALVLLAPFGRSSLQAQEVTLASVDALHRWVDAVNSHVPGQPDAAVGSVVAMTYAARLELNRSFPLFMRVLREDSIVTRTEIERGVTTFARMLRSHVGTEAFLTRAAVLHGDAVVLARRFPRPPDDEPTVVPMQRPYLSDAFPVRRPQDPPLLTNERIILTRDGQVMGETKIIWHLPFARSLIDTLLKQEPKLDPDGQCPPPCGVVKLGSRFVSADHHEFAAGWYHAIAAHLFSRAMNGDATGHLLDAARVFPDEPRLLFDRGTYAEWLGLPIYQVLSLLVPEEKTNADAERMYRRALDVDASYVEARVRLARLLDRRGRHDEAAKEIATALQAQPTGVVGFYAQIVAGRIAAARGRYDEAFLAYREASALFGRAQSALLGASHASLMLAGVPAALAPLATLGGDNDADPWLDYSLGAGRDAQSLLAAVWGRVPRNAP